jgi:hypothetical protein
MADQGKVVFRQRICRGCNAVFCICRSCDRGQRYCGPGCRLPAVREQRRRANRRHQNSPEGRLDHRDRQRAYRKRCAQRRWASVDPGVEKPGTSLVDDRQVGALQPASQGLGVTSSSLGAPSLPEETAAATKNVTDTSFAALTCSSMIAAWNSGPAQLVVPSSSAAPISGFGSEPTGSKDWHPTLGCISCGRRGRFVDPFPRGMKNAEISPPAAST